MSTRTHGNIKRSKQNGKSYPLSTRELCEAIVEAHFQIKEREKLREKLQKEKWEQEVGIRKNNDKKPKKLIKDIKDAIYNMRLLFHLKESQIQDGTVSVPLMAALISTFFVLFTVFIFLALGIAIIASFLLIFIERIYFAGLLGIVFSVCLWPLGRLTWVVSKELMQTTDKQYLTAFSSSVFSLIALIIAAISFLYKK